MMLLDWEVSESICKSLCRSLTPCCFMLLSGFFDSESISIVYLESKLHPAFLRA